MNQQHADAARILGQLHEIGAINLDVVLGRSAEIQKIVGLDIDDPEYRICYRFVMHIGPRLENEIDLVSVASQIRELGFDVVRAG